MNRQEADEINKFVLEYEYAESEALISVVSTYELLNFINSLVVEDEICPKCKIPMRREKVEYGDGVGDGWGWTCFGCGWSKQTDFLVVEDECSCGMIDRLTNDDFVCLNCGETTHYTPIPEAEAEIAKRVLMEWLESRGRVITPRSPFLDYSQWLDEEGE